MVVGSRIWAKGLALTVAVACGLVAGCSSASSKSGSPPLAIPGVVGGSSAGTGTAGTAGTVLVGGFAPGGTADPWAAGALAYFQWLNASGGVLGRAISYKVLDDHGGTALVPSLVHRLVQQDAVFALFGVQGTAQNLAASPYLTQSGVPDLFAGSVCGCFNSAVTHPEVYTWPINATREGEILGAFAARRFEGQKVGVLYSPDESGQDGLAGFVSAAGGLRLARKAAVGGVSGLPAALDSLKAAGASVVVAFTSAELSGGLGAALARISYSPRLVVAGGPGTSLPGLPDGTITDSFLPEAGMPARSAGASWVALFSRIARRYLPKVPLTPVVIDGMAAAYEFAAALFRAGPALNRQSLVTALTGLAQGPAMAPLAYTQSDHGGVSGAYMGLVRGGSLTPLTGAVVADGIAAGVVSSYGYPQQTAPASGIPPH